MDGHRTKLVQSMIDIIMDKAQRTMKVEMAENAVYFMLSSMVGSVRNPRYVDDDKVGIINYFAITLAETGSGKDFALNTCRKMFKSLPDSYRELLITKYNIAMAGLPNGEKGIAYDDDEYYLLPSDFFTPIDGTKEGMQKLMQGMSILPHNGLNMVEDELGDIILNADILSRIKSAWDSGEAKGKTTVSGKYFRVEDVTVNMLIYGSPHSIRKYKNKTNAFEDVLIEGFLRRSFVFLDANGKVTRNHKYKKLSSKEKSDKMEFIQSFEETLKTSNINYDITFCDTALELLESYSWDLIEESNHDFRNMFKRAVANSSEKIKRLACIVAISDFADHVEKRHMEIAIDFTNRTNSMAEEVVTPNPIHEQIFEYTRNKECARTEIFNNITGNITSRAFDEYIELAEEYGEKLGYAMVRKEIGKVKSFKFEPLSNIDENSISLSVSNDIAKGFKEKKGKFNKLHEILTKSINYSAGTFVDNYRNRENYKGSQDIIILDIDDGISLNQAKIFFADWKCIIATTKSHQIAKHGKICDRYRVILLPNVKIEMDYNTYSEFMGNIYDRLGIQIDSACRDASRFYFGFKDSKVWYSGSENRFDIRCCIPETKKNIEAKARDAKIKDSDSLVRYFIRETKSGNRNNHLYRYGAMMQDSGDEWEAKVIALNSKLDEPLDTKELNSTVLSSLKNKK